MEDTEEIISSTPPHTRREARRIALQALYALELSGNSLYSVLEELLGPVQKDNLFLSFSREVVTRTFECRDELDGYIRRRAMNWDFERIAIIDKIVLRMAICEFLYFSDVPLKVSIDEAIELSKYYSTEKSGAFINGILDAVIKDLLKYERVVKTGRGLVEKEKCKKAE